MLCRKLSLVGIYDGVDPHKIAFSMHHINEFFAGRHIEKEDAEQISEENLRRLFRERDGAAIRKKYGEIPEDKGERQKLMAAMMRLGYDADTVRESMREILKKS